MKLKRWHAHHTLFLFLLLSFLVSSFKRRFLVKKRRTYSSVRQLATATLFFYGIGVHLYCITLTRNCSSLRTESKTRSAAGSRHSVPERKKKMSSPLFPPLESVTLSKKEKRKQTQQRCSHYADAVASKDQQEIVFTHQHSPDMNISSRFSAAILRCFSVLLVVVLIAPIPSALSFSVPRPFASLTSSMFLSLTRWILYVLFIYMSTSTLRAPWGFTEGSWWLVL